MLSTVQNVALHFWKLLAYACQIEILDTSVCVTLPSDVDSAFPLGGLRRQIASTVILIYLMDDRPRLMNG
jgi:hypothetical protein